MCPHVFTLQAMNNQSNKSYCLILAINITDAHGISNEVCHEFLPKKTGNAIFSIHFIVKGINQFYIINK